MKDKKLNLKVVQVKSFITGDVKGGGYTDNCETSLHPLSDPVHCACCNTTAGATQDPQACFTQAPEYC